MDFMIHPCRWINDERMVIGTFLPSALGKWGGWIYQYGIGNTSLILVRHGYNATFREWIKKNECFEGPWLSSAVSR